MGTPQIPSVDSDTKQFPDSVRARIASNIADSSSVEGSSLATVLGSFNFPNNISQNDWMEGWIESAFMPPPPADVPTIAWSGTNATGISSPVVYSPPVLGGSSQVTGWDGQSDTNILFNPGIYQTGNGPSQASFLYGSTKPGGLSQAAAWPVIFSFTTDATNAIVELGMFSSSTDKANQVLIEVNGRLISDTLIKSPGVSNGKSMTLTFPVARSRTIRIWSGANIGLQAVRVPAGGSITKPPAPKNVVAIIGDSYVNGQGDSGNVVAGANALETFGPRLLRLLGADAFILAGIGGTGWTVTTDTDGSSNNYASRLATLMAMNPAPTSILFYGSQNDGTAAGGIQAAVTSVLNQIPSSTRVIVISTLLNGYSAANAAVKTGTIASGRRFVDMTNWLFGTGYVDNLKWDGNRDVFLQSASNLHMTLAGHRSAARAIYRRIMTGTS